MTPLKSSQFQLSDDDDIDVMIECHLQLKEILTSIEVYTKIDGA